MKTDLIKEYEENDKNGKYRCKQYKNGIITRALIEPSKEYRDKVKKKAEESAKKKAIMEEKEKTERMIKERMREIAIRELKKEGKL